MNTKAEIGSLISHWRKTAGLSQAALADAIGVQQTTVSKIESGQQNLTVGTMLDLLSACGLTLSQVASEIEQVVPITNKPLWERIDE